MRLFWLVLVLFGAVPAAAQSPEWRAARDHEVLLRPYAYDPDPIRLEAGRPVKLHFRNQGQATYSFSAEDFFAAAQIRRGDEEKVAGGHLRLPPGEREVIALVPAPGRYRARSGNILHRLLGMSVEIIVE